MNYPMIKSGKIFFILFFISALSNGQMNSYRYQRKLMGVNGTWQKLELPESVLSRTNPDLSDVRIYGITASGDTIEAPYLLRNSKGKNIQREVESTILNTSRKDNSYYYTFDIPSRDAVNTIMLRFSQNNFEWFVRLEGSNDQHEWFTLLENYRILSINNSLTDYSFTNLSFPKSSYRYFRLRIPSKENPSLISANISQQETEPTLYRKYDAQLQTENSGIEKKETVFNIDLKSKLPVSFLKIHVKDTVDYYRPVRILSVTDSFQTEKGWKYNFETLATGTLNSIEKNEFNFASASTEKIRIEINNGDNMPLNIASVEVKGYLYDLVIRITEPGDYFLVYGNKKASMPQYDIERFAEKISTTATHTEIKLGEEMPAGQPEQLPSPPFFKSKVWLWSLMGVIIIILGWFTMRMLKRTTE